MLEAMMKFRLFQWCAAAVVALFGLVLPAHADGLVVGRDYLALQPGLTTSDPTKIEVVEFFSYACGHCSNLNPDIKKWASKLPAGVVFKRIAAPGNPYWSLLSRLYYSLEAIGELDRLDETVFNALHVKGLRLIDENSILEWVTAQGVDARKFSDAFNSFGVATKVRQADQMSREARIQGVPTLIVDGRYQVVGKFAKTHDELLALTDKIIDKRRRERAKQ